MSVIDLFPDSSWCWFQDPRAVYYNGKTYFGALNMAGDVIVCSYNHSTKKVKHATVRAAFEADDHDVPALQVLPSGRIMVWWSAHGGAKLYYRLTQSPGDIESWGIDHIVPVNIPTNTYQKYTYPNPIYLPSENKTYLFWRGGPSGNATMSSTLATTQDFDNWTSARKFWESGTRPYVKVCTDGVSKIHFFVSDTHPREAETNSLYHFYYTSGKWYNSAGTVIKTSDQLPTSPIKPSQATKVYNSTTTNGKGWNWDIALDSAGNPVVVYARFVTNDDHRYHYSKWSGTAWVDTELTAAGAGIAEDPGEPNYSGGIVIDSLNTNIVYLSRQTTETTWEIEKWEFDGTSWTSESLTPNSTTKNVRPMIPRNHNGLDVIWVSGGYRFYTDFDTDYKGWIND